MRKIYLLLAVKATIIIYLLAYTSQNVKAYKNNKAAFQIPFKKPDTTYEIIPAAANTYGYKILIKNKTLIKQLTIPGRPGTNGFKRKEDATKVARLVIKKLDKGIMPPTVDEKELIKLKIKL